MILQLFEYTYRYSTEKRDPSPHKNVAVVRAADQLVHARVEGNPAHRAGVSLEHPHELGRLRHFGRLLFLCYASKNIFQNLDLYANLNLCCRFSLPRLL